MIVVDLSQVLFANYFSMASKNEAFDPGMFRHLALNMLRSINQKNRRQYGDMVLAVDSMNYWRRERFPHYKHRRRVDRKASAIDWSEVFQSMDQLKLDLQEYFPYKFMQVDRCEADDVIAALVVGGRTEDDRVLIVSSDKDFRQLHFKGVSQYDPIQKKKIFESDPVGYLHEHIIRGDVGDGIPNACSPDDTFVTGKRQKPMTKKAMALFEHPHHIEDPTYHKYYLRNKQLVDLSQIPQELVDNILLKFKEPPNVPDRSMLLPYFMKHRLRNLVEFVNDF